jgi:hypothetical protein
MNTRLQDLRKTVRARREAADSTDVRQGKATTPWRFCASPGWLTLCLALGLAACSNTPPPPDWQMNAKSSLERAADAWLSGHSAVEAVEFVRARNEVARTGQPERLARVELLRCATRVAVLVFEPCAGFQALALDAAPAEHAYARYLAGQAQAADAPLLPETQRPLAQAAAQTLMPAQAQAPHQAQRQAQQLAQQLAQVQAQQPAQAALEAALARIQDPLSRLVAAGVLLQRGLASPAVATLAADTAAAQGWRRPLLAWLRVQQARAQASGAADEVARLQRRIDLVAPVSSPTPTSP